MKLFAKTNLSRLVLSEKDIHIWWSNLDSPNLETEKHYQMLSDDEKVRVGRFYFEKDRKRFLIRHGMLRIILGWYLGVEGKKLEFYYGKNGKPRLIDSFDKRNIHFSMSSTEGLGLYGFTRSGKIGVDVECIRDIPEMNQIAKQFFSIKENEILSSLCEGNRKKAFFNCWTRKEAYLKGIGAGLSHPLNKFDVTLTPGAPARLLRVEGDSKATSHWSIQDLEPAAGVAAAFAVEGRGWRVHCWQW